MKLLSLILSYANGALSATQYRLRNNGTGIVTEISSDGGETYTTLTTVSPSGDVDSGAVTASGTGTPATFGGGVDTTAPSTGTHVLREFVIGSDGAIYVCTVAGTPGTWVKVSPDGP